MQYHITITFPQGPTIMDDDQTPVMIKRVEHTEERVTKIQQAALLLGAMNVIIEHNQANKA